jgi:hypothetical protein
MKQTAVEWLVEQMSKEEITFTGLRAYVKFPELIQQAKEMEKAEKIKAQIEAVRAVDTYGLKHMIEHYEQQLKELTFKSE